MGKGVKYAGAFNRKDTPLRQLPEKPLKLGANFFRELVRRIETIVPVDGDGIKVIKPDGSAPGLKITLDAETITLNVCSNGTPSTIEVFTKRNDSTQT